MTSKYIHKNVVTTMKPTARQVYLLSTTSASLRAESQLLVAKNSIATGTELHIAVIGTASLNISMQE